MLNCIVKKKNSILFDTSERVIKIANNPMIEKLVMKKAEKEAIFLKEELATWDLLTEKIQFIDSEITNDQCLISDLGGKELRPIIYTLYDTSLLLGEVMKYPNKKTVPVFIYGDKIYVGPIGNKVEYIKNFITRLCANDTEINKRKILKDDEPIAIYYNKEVIMKNKAIIAEAIMRLNELSLSNGVMVIQRGEYGLHTFIPMFKEDSDGSGRDLLDAVDPYVGIVREVKTESLKDIGVDIYVSVSTTTDYSIYDANMFAQSNSGAGLDELAAKYSAVGESIERLAAGCYQPEVILDSWKNIEVDAVHPQEFILFSEKQYAEDGFPYRKFDEDTQVRWTKSINISEGKEQYIPLAFVKLPYKVCNNEERISPAISTGLALGKTKEQAILSGIFEVVERDAFSVSWFLKKAPNRRIQLEDYFSDFKKILDKRYICNAYDISLENLFHTVVVTIHDQISGNFMIGAATRLTMDEAVKKAFLEAAQGITYVNMLVRNYKDHELIRDYNTINTFQKHAAFYSIYPYMRKEVGYIVDENYLFTERMDSSFSLEDKNGLADKNKLEIAIETLKSAGKSIHYINMTTDELTNINVSAARIIIPGLQQLHGSHKYRFLNPERMNKFRVQPGSNINEYPHPFP